MIFVRLNFINMFTKCASRSLSG